MRKILTPENFAILFLIALAVTAYHDNPPVEQRNATLLKVTDGDTIDTSVNGRNDTVRLLGVDTPETSARNTPEEYGLEDTVANRACLERHGEKAANLLERKLDGKIEIRTDPEADRRGGYGRLLAYIYDSNISINRLLLEKGLARVYTGKFSREKEYLEIEKNARKEGRGLWDCPLFN